MRFEGIFLLGLFSAASIHMHAVQASVSNRFLKDFVETVEKLAHEKGTSMTEMGDILGKNFVVKLVEKGEDALKIAFARQPPGGDVKSITTTTEAFSKEFHKIATDWLNELPSEAANLLDDEPS